MSFFRQLSSLQSTSESRLEWVAHLDLVRVLRRGWRYPAIAAAASLTLAVLYLVGQTRMYQATARLLVLQQGGPPLSALDNGRMLGGDDYLPTHAAILKSPLVIGRAIESVGVANLPTLAAANAKSGRGLVAEAIDEITISRPDRAAKIVEIDYRAGSREEATRMVAALVASYESFLEDKFQKSNGDVVTLISSARDNLRKELVAMQSEYLEFRKAHPASSTDEAGRPFMSRRLDQWDRAANEAMVKEVQLRSQIELGRTLATENVATWAVIHAMNQLGGGDPATPAHLAEPAQGGALDYVRQLGREQQELTEKFGPNYSKVREIQEQVTRIQQRAREARGRIDRVEVDDLLGSLEQSLKTIQTMRGEMAKQFRQDLERAKQTENDLLVEADLKGNIAQLRLLFNTTVEQLKRAQLVGDYNGINAQVIEPANSLPSPVRPRVGLTLALAMLCGLVSGGAAALLADRMDLRIRSLDALRDVLSLPLLGRVPEKAFVNGSGSLGLIARLEPFSPQSEAFREVRTHLDLVRRDGAVRAILVTSPRPGDGKSTTASNLAIGLAHAGRRVLLVDADLRRPTQDVIHGQPRERGLAQLLQGTLPIHRAIRSAGIADLDLMVAGAVVSNPSELLMSIRFSEFLQTARQSYDLVIIDSSPLLSVADAAILGSVVDAVVLVARPSTLRTRDAARASEILKGLGTPVLGVVANRVDADEAGYGYGYQATRDDLAGTRIRPATTPPKKPCPHEQPVLVGDGDDVE